MKHWEQAAKMKSNILSRIFVIIFCAVVFVTVLVVNALAGAGRGKFYKLALSGRVGLYPHFYINFQVFSSLSFGLSFTLLF